MGLDPQRRSKLRIGIATSGRFHLLDLARELDALGMEVRFYSYVSRTRAAKFGLPGHCHVALLPFLFPLAAFQRLLPKVAPRTIERLMSWTLDLLVILRMQPCDVFVCMSGIYLQAPRYAKRRYGAKILLHRGSRHVLSQRDILAPHPQAGQVSRFMVGRELDGYAIADYIAVPSTHVVESFAPWPEHARKLFLNPYGVDLDQFPLRSCRLSAEPTVLFVGHWSYRKGADVLAQAIKGMQGVRLVHVGALLDVPFPNHLRFIHHDPVTQSKLKDFYAAAHVFAIASREDGLAVVQVQALASGLSLVCSDRSGGSDLASVPQIARLIRVVPAGDPDALRLALTRALDDAMGETGPAPITQLERRALSWTAYALRDLQFMTGIS
jgi:glycosyltransferase involved in cell wall biosynthesis